MRDFHREYLCHDPIHGYIPFTSGEDLPAGEVSERQIIDHPWVQRLRFIHQLQTAWWVYPSAEHTRFQHVLGVMHLASRAVESLYDSLHATCDTPPSKGYVETLLRMAGLLHDFDLDRILRYSFFTESGLTIHDRGIDALLRFMTVRAELFRAIDFHRTVRAIDLTLADLFRDGKEFIFAGDPLEHLPRYRQLTEASLLVDVGRWHESEDPAKREMGQRWQQLLRREVPWRMICQKTHVFSERDSESSSIFSDNELVERKIRENLPSALEEIPLRVDIARHIFRPHTQGPASGQNFLYDSVRDRVRPLTTNALFRRTPVSQRICRVHAQSAEYANEVPQALDALAGEMPEDDLTNM